MEYWVYILYSERSNRYYIGQTRNITERLARHNAGSENSTAPFRPWLLLWKTAKYSRSEAIILERKLKNLSRNRIKLFIEKYK
ncbi:MAG: GIY-YIG nuclease family protein [Hydrotalea sp.]|nr:GIY-YIG nuclease family protein [Hydrotalea sp.]MCG9900029.1 GIY-YIG nuclease family protein [Hydrotalea sp.]